MATVYVKDDILMQYAAEAESIEEAKADIQAVVAENAPGGNDE